MFNRANEKIRKAMRDADVKQWEVAERFGLSEDRFCRRLRHELPAEEQERILVIIEQIASERSESNA